MAKTKAAIREVRDQLFLDRADGQYLTSISANLNVVRPSFGFSNDDIWRALVRRLALDYRQVANLFYDFMTILFGPRKTVYTVLANSTELLDTEITIADQYNIPQVGTLVIDEGLTTEETFVYGFRDPRDGLVELSNSLSIQQAHTAVGENAAAYLTADLAAAATSLVVEDSTGMPTADFPYTIIVNPGGATEEVVTLLGNTVGTNTLTIDAPGLVNAQLGPQPTYRTTLLQAVVSGGSVIRVLDSAQFPSEGLLRLQLNDGTNTTAENIRFYSNDLETGTLQLATSLTNSYSISTPTTSVTLMNPGATVALAQVQVKGVDWDIFQTEQNILKIYLPDTLSQNRLADASYVHNELVSPTPATTVGTASAVGDIVLSAATGGTLDFPSSGTIVINAGGGSEETVGYLLREPKATAKLSASSVSGIPIGTTVLYVDDAQLLLDHDASNSNNELVIGNNDVPNLETVVYTAIDPVENKITLSTATANAHTTGTNVHPRVSDRFILGHALQSTHAIGETIGLYQPVYAGTSLEDGRAYSGTDHLYQGSYVYEPLTDAPTSTETYLSENVAGPTTLAVDQKAGRTVLEVKNATLFNSSGTFDVRVGRGLAADVTVDTSGVVLKRSVTGVTVASGPYSPEVLQLTLSSTASLPAPSASPYDYRLLIDKDGSNEEIVVVTSISGSNISLDSVTTKSHATSETVELMADCIELSNAIPDTVQGKLKITSRLVRYWTQLDIRTPDQTSLVEEIRTQVEVASLTSFPSAGSDVLINYGRQKLSVEDQLVTAASAGGSTLVCASTDDFPTSGYPYWVEVGVGTDIAELVLVTSNNTIADQLNLDASTTLQFAHPVGEWVQHVPGEQVSVSYTGTLAAPNRLLFSSGIRFSEDHLKNEPVQLATSGTPSVYGRGYPFYLPTSLVERLQFLIDKGRAAGVQVVLTSDR